MSAIHPAQPTPAAAGAPRATVTAASITHRYRERTALHAVNFSVNGGELFAVLGPNGGGKSTLFRILSTLMPPSEGHVELLGADPARNLNRARAHLGVVFQSPSLDPMLTARENLVHQGHLYRLRGAELNQRIGELLTAFGLDDRAGDRINTFSGGMRRRLEIAKSLLHRPRILILDEPSTGLDPGARRDMWTLLEDLRAERGLTVLFTTHLMDEAGRADRVLILDRGHKVALDTPAALTGEVGGDVLWLDTDDPPALAREISARFQVEATPDTGRVRLERERGHEFVPELVEAFPGRIRSLAVGQPTLEDVFLRRTGRQFAEAQAEGTPPPKRRRR